MATKPEIAALWLWYRGDFFRGYQAQVEGPTVQQALVARLSQLGVRSGPSPAGRTDLGVHARMQVVSLKLPEHLSAEELARGLSTGLPAGLGVCAVQGVRKFHAQWHCQGKEYRYRLALGAHRAPEGLDLGKLEELLRRAVGTRDFWAFHEKSSPRKPRTLGSARLLEVEPGVVEVVLRGDGFGRYQVRYLVGSMVEAAAGLASTQELLTALDEGREFRGLKAPPHGLVLWEVFYPSDRDPFPGSLRAAPALLPGEPPFVGANGSRHAD